MTFRTPLFPILLATVLGAPVPLAAQAQDGDLRRLFPRTAEVTGAAPGFNRIPLPAAVLAACRPDLSDLRLVGASGEQVPFAVVATPPPETPRTAVARREARIEEVQRHEARSPSGPPVYHETYTLTVPRLPEGASHWVVALVTHTPRFVCSLGIDASDARGVVQAVVTGGSAFRLGEGGHENLRFPLPSRGVRRVVVRLSGENGSYLDPRFELLAMPGPPAPEPLTIPLEGGDTMRPGGRTVVTWSRASGVVPSAVRMRTATPAFFRRVTVWDVQAGGHAVKLGSGEIFRAGVGTTTVEHLRIPVAPPVGREIRLEIEDGDSPPLREVGLHALVPRPELVAQLPRGGTASLYFGGGRARSPRYDIAGLVGRVPAFAPERIASLPEATVGAITHNPLFDPAPVLGFLHHAGAPLDVRTFRYIRSLHVIPSEEGLSVLTLEPADQAVLQDDLLGDLRVVDGDARQWAFLLAGWDTHAPLEVAYRRETPGRGLSRYRFELPAASLSAAGLTVDFAASFFDRPVRLTATTATGTTRTLLARRVARRQGDTAPVVLPFGPVRLKGLVLEVEDGGDAPLEMVSAHLMVARPSLFLPAPAGRYTLLLGDPAAAPPRYELESLRSTILGVPAAPVTTGPLEPNPRFSARARLLSGGTPAQSLLWGALALAVMVLVGLSLRLARQEPGP